MTIKFFYPGPVFVDSGTLNAQTGEITYHRSNAFRRLYRNIRTNLAALLGVRKGRLFLLTSSATGAMEMAVRNLVHKRALCVSSGAFADRWHEVAISNCVESDLLSNGWGRSVSFGEIKARLASGRYDCVNIVHSETSTGFANPIELFKSISTAFPDVTLCVDGVSSVGAYPVFPEELGIDFMFVGSPKCLAMPPGLTILYASERAISKAKGVKNRGYYFDLQAFARFDELDETTQTPPVTLVYALDHALRKVLAEGIDARYKRHAEVASMTREWVKSRGFNLFPEAGFESVTVTCVENSRDVSVPDLLNKLARDGYVISNGYSRLKDRTFRIGHMGEISKADILELFSTMEKYI